jgi:hypothetical protein
MLSGAARKRLIGALNLLASPVAGEREAAATAAQRIVAGAGLTWEQVIPKPAQELRDEDDGGNWRALAATLLRSHTTLFDGYELPFLAKVRNLASLSPKQLGWLRRLAGRAGLAQKTRRGARAA